MLREVQHGMVFSCLCGPVTRADRVGSIYLMPRFRVVPQASIVNGVEEGRLIFDNLKKSINYTVSKLRSACCLSQAVLVDWCSCAGALGWSRSRTSR